MSLRLDQEPATPCLFSLLSKVRKGTREGELLPLSAPFSVSIYLSGEVVREEKKKRKGGRRIGGNRGGQRGEGGEGEERIGIKGEDRVGNK